VTFRWLAIAAGAAAVVMTACASPVRFATPEEVAAIENDFRAGGFGYGDFKKQLFEKLWEHFAPMRKRREEILADKLYIDNVLVRGARRANEIADDVMTRVRAAVGL